MDGNKLKGTQLFINVPRRKLDIMLGDGPLDPRLLPDAIASMARDGLTSVEISGITPEKLEVIVAAWSRELADDRRKRKK